MTLSAILYLNTLFSDIFDQYTCKNEFFSDQNQSKEIHKF